MKTIKDFLIESREADYHEAAGNAEHWAHEAKRHEGGPHHRAQNAHDEARGWHTDAAKFAPDEASKKHHLDRAKFHDGMYNYHQHEDLVDNAPTGHKQQWGFKND